jgi:hypothetical protein
MSAILTQGGLYITRVASSAIIDRASQYSMVDSSNPSALQQWTGRLNRGPNLIMIGEIKADQKTGLYYYIEAIYDQFKFGTMVVKTVAQCSPVGNAIEASPFRNEL